MVLYYSPVQNQAVRYYATAGSGTITPILEKVFTPTEAGDAYTIPGINMAVSETTMYAIVGAIIGAGAMFFLTRKK